MFVRGKWNPLFAAPGENSGADGGTDSAGADDTAIDDAGVDDQSQDDGIERVDGPGSGRSKLRQQLEGAADKARKVADKAAKRAEKGPKRVAGGATIEDGADGTAADADADAEQGEQPDQAAEADATPAPAALSKEAKAEWAKTPKAVQQAFLKREADMAKGVTEIKEKYADIDKALEPHIQAIRQNGHSPASAINQMFGWFQALQANPDVAFPALIQSFKWDPRKVLGGQQAQQGQQGQQGGEAGGDQPPGDVPPAVQKYIDDLKTQIGSLATAVNRQIGGLQTTITQQSQQKTQEILDQWSQGKEYFEDVRQLMGQMLAAGMVPLKDGRVDLDLAYDMAVNAHPEVRGRMSAAAAAKAAAEAKAKREAEVKAQKEQAEKARKAGVSIAGGAPGNGSGVMPAKKGKAKSVRESLEEARKEVTERYS